MPQAQRKTQHFLLILLALSVGLSVSALAQTPNQKPSQKPSQMQNGEDPAQSKPEQATQAPQDEEEASAAAAQKASEANGSEPDQGASDPEAGAASPAPQAPEHPAANSTDAEHNQALTAAAASAAALHSPAADMIPAVEAEAKPAVACSETVQHSPSACAQSTVQNAQQRTQVLRWTGAALAGVSLMAASGLAAWSWWERHQALDVLQNSGAFADLDGHIVILDGTDPAVNAYEAHRQGAETLSFLAWGGLALSLTGVALTGSGWIMEEALVPCVQKEPHLTLR